MHIAADYVTITSGFRPCCENHDADLVAVFAPHLLNSRDYLKNGIEKLHWGLLSFRVTSS